jgi:PhnB protein
MVQEGVRGERAGKRDGARREADSCKSKDRGQHEDPLQLGGTSVTLHIYSKNVDALWSRAVEAGAKVGMELGDMFWGERYGQLTDPFGHSWSVSMRIPMSRKTMEEQRAAAMKMFEQGQHPGS